MANDTSNYPDFVFIAYDEDFSAQTHDVAVSLEAGSLVGVPLKYVRHDLNTRPAAPVEGVRRLSLVRGGGLEDNKDGDYVRFDQAEAIIAAERAAKGKADKRVEFLLKQISRAADKRKAIEADNAALTARVKEVEKLLEITERTARNELKQSQALETQLAARNKVLTDIQCIDWDGLSVSDVFDEINEIVERAALEAKP